MAANLATTQHLRKASHLQAVVDKVHLGQATVVTTPNMVVEGAVLVQAQELNVLVVAPYLAEEAVAQVTVAEKATTRTLVEMVAFGVVIPQAARLTAARRQAQALKVLTDYSDVVTVAEGGAGKTLAPQGQEAQEEFPAEVLAAVVEALLLAVHQDWAAEAR